MKSLGITASMMILYNMLAWPYIHEVAESRPPIENFKTEESRVDELIKQSNVVVEFLRTIQGKAQRFAQKEEWSRDKDGQDQKPQIALYNDKRVRVFDQTNSLMLEATLVD